MKKTFLFLVEGFEEMEAIAVVDVLRRGGVDVRTVSVGESAQVKSAHGVVITADHMFREVESEEAEGLIFPGGMPGAQHLGDFKPLIQWMQRQYEEGGYIAAICAAPALVLGQLKAGRKVRLTCYPGFEKYLSSDFEVVTEGVMVDDKIMTGKGPGFAVSFGLKVLEQLRSREKADEVAGGMLL